MAQQVLWKKEVSDFSISLFTLSSLLCGSAWSLRASYFSESFRASAAALFSPFPESILLETFPPRQHGMAMAIFGVGIMFGPHYRPLLAGLDY